MKRRIFLNVIIGIIFGIFIVFGLDKVLNTPMIQFGPLLIPSNTIVKQISCNLPNSTYIVTLRNAKLINATISTYSWEVNGVIINTTKECDWTEFSL